MNDDFKGNIANVLAKEIAESIDADMRKRDKIFEDVMDGEIWKPRSIKKKYMQDKWRRELYNDWEEVQRHARDPVQQLRDEMREELRDVKRALRKVGILLDSDAPTEEQLKKHKALKRAYQKYKMTEKLILGSEVRED